MNYLLLSIGSAGDVNPFLTAGAALKSRGHRVTLITSEFFRDGAEAAGIGFYLLGSRVPGSPMKKRVSHSSHLTFSRFHSGAFINRLCSRDLQYRNIGRYQLKGLY